MLVKEKMFEKNFTEIKDFQNKSNLSYCLITEENNYGIEIDRLEKEENYVQTHKNISLDKNLVIDILTYVYENAVPIETSEDIIKELIEKRKVAIN